MVYYLTDASDELIQINQEVIDKSNVLKDFFDKNPTKIFHLKFEKSVIKEMFLSLKNNDSLFLSLQNYESTNNQKLRELYQYLNIKLKTDKFNENTDMIKTQPYIAGQGHYIFNSIFFLKNEQYKTHCIESMIEPEIIYRVNVDGVDFTMSENEFKNQYNTLPGNYFTKRCEKLINGENVDNADIMSENQFSNQNQTLLGNQNGRISVKKQQMCRGKVDMQYKYYMTILSPRIQLVIDTYNIGQLFNEKISDVLINQETFDYVVELLVSHLDPGLKNPDQNYKQLQTNEITKNQSLTVCDSNRLFTNFNHIIMIQKNYKEFIVKIKRIISSDN